MGGEFWVERFQENITRENITTIYFILKWKGTVGIFRWRVWVER